MGPDSSKNLHPARLGKLARLPRPAPARLRIHPSVPAAELFARIRVPKSLPEALTDTDLPAQRPALDLLDVLGTWPRSGPGPGVVIDITELLERRALQGRDDSAPDPARTSDPARATGSQEPTP